MGPQYLPTRTADCLRDSDPGYGGPRWPTCDVGGQGVSSLPGTLGGGMGGSLISQDLVG